MKKVMAGFLAAVMLTGITLAGQPGVETKAKTGISKSEATIFTGEQLQLNLKGTKKKVTWKSSKKSVATVDKEGVVTGKKKGKCVIKASSGGKNYNCQLTVKTLPKNYATINGKKVKVGGKVKITYTLFADKPLDDTDVHYYYYEKEIKILTSSEDKMRFKTWVYYNGGDDLNPGQQAYRIDFYQCGGVNPKDPYSTTLYPVSCKKGKEFDSFYVKALKHGNFTLRYEFGGRNKGKDVKVTVKETIK
ncbi:MAG: Ig-like domain-containing protein [Lachnospiraceae bacterium]|nr:Ig-like domain-containing protein [Lachnospiraceae bacterium]